MAAQRRAASLRSRAGVGNPRVSSAAVYNLIMSVGFGRHKGPLPSVVVTAMQSHGHVTRIHPRPPTSSMGAHFLSHVTT